MYLAHLAMFRGELGEVSEMTRSAWETGNDETWPGVAYLLTPLVSLSKITGSEAPMLQLRELLTPWQAYWADPRDRLARAILSQSAGVGRDDSDFEPPTPDVRQMLLGHAVELAQVAVDREPAEPGYWNTLGVALYCSGDAEGAIAALERESELLGEGNAINWLCLALAQHALGREDLARDLYARATDWMAANETDEQQRWYRAETARALGMR